MLSLAEMGLEHVSHGGFLCVPAHMLPGNTSYQVSQGRGSVPHYQSTELVWSAIMQWLLCMVFSCTLNVCGFLIHPHTHTHTDTHCLINVATAGYMWLLLWYCIIHIHISVSIVLSSETIDFRDECAWASTFKVVNQTEYYIGCIFSSVPRRLHVVVATRLLSCNVMMLVSHPSLTSVFIFPLSVHKKEKHKALLLECEETTS